MGRTACTEPQCLYSRAIPLLPLWAVRPVQSLSACTGELNLYSPYGPYGLYRASVPVQGCTFYIGPCTVAYCFKLKKARAVLSLIKCVLFLARRLDFGVMVFDAGPKCDFLSLFIVKLCDLVAEFRLHTAVVLQDCDIPLHLHCPICSNRTTTSLQDEPCKL
jgi:hypothetical protein